MSSSIDTSQGPAGTADRTPREVALDVINGCVFGRLRQINRVVTARYDSELREHGITANQVTILAVITVLGQVTPRDAEPYLQMDSSTLSRNVARMLEHNWLATTPSADKRSHYLVVAPAGMEMLREVRPAWERAQAWAYEMFGDGDIGAVRRIANQVNPVIPE